jgi:hypothetical protein
MTRYFTLLVGCALAITSCTKNQNVLKGKITYKDITGVTSNAPAATVNVMSTDDKAGLSYTYQTKTGNDGSYAINQVADGEWYIYAVFAEDTLTYKGKSDLFKVKGDDEVVRDLTLNR